MRPLVRLRRLLSLSLVCVAGAPFLVPAGAAQATTTGDPCPSPFTVHQVPTANSNPYAIANGPDGAVWFSELGGDEGQPRKIGRISTAGQIAEYPATTSPYAQITGLTAGPDHALWYTSSSGNTGLISRLTTTRWKPTPPPSATSLSPQAQALPASETADATVAAAAMAICLAFMAGYPLPCIRLRSGWQ